MASKHPKAFVEDVTRALPQEVLSHILSLLLSTREAVKTSVLSNRWKNLWASLSNLDFNEHEFLEGPHRFVDFVNRVLILRDQSTSIHRFRLHCSGRLILASQFAVWVCTAVKHNVSELDLTVGQCYPTRKHTLSNYYRIREDLELPKSLFTCNTLVRLRLLLDPKLNTSNAPTTSNGFPSLKFLHVTLYHPNPNSVEKLISCCAGLEDLIIDGEIGVLSHETFYLSVSAPKLKRLQLSFQLDRLTSRDVNNNCRTFIDADVPYLEELDICYEFLVSYSFKDVKSLSKVKFDFKIPGKFLAHPVPSIHLGHADRVRRLFTDISRVKHLSVSTNYILMVRNTGYTCCPHLVSLGFECLPSMYISLQRLEVQLKTCYCWQSLMSLLRISPNLEHLAVDSVDLKCTHSVADNNMHECWHPPDIVAVCLASNLKTICFTRFQGTPNEMKVVKYMRKHGEVLDEMMVFDLCGKSYKVPKGFADL